MDSPTASGAVSDVKESARTAADSAKATATDRIEQGKSRATDMLGEAADALHETADSLRENDHDAFARYAESAADQVASFTEAIRGRSVGDLLDEAESFARRDPGLFLGGAFVLGIFGARFLKASAPNRMSGTRSRNGSGYGSGPAGLGASRLTGTGTAGASRPTGVGTPGGGSQVGGLGGFSSPDAPSTGSASAASGATPRPGALSPTPPGSTL